MDEYDIVIVGGGLVGASLACALGGLQQRVAVLEASPFDSVSQPSFDARTVALAYTSKQVFSAMGLWDAISALGVAPIKTIHVSDRGHAGVTHLDSKQEGVDAFGYVVETRVLGQVLGPAMQGYENIELLCPATLKNFFHRTSHVELQVQQADMTRTIKTRLLIAADGVNSVVRRMANVKAFTRQYDQCAIIANVRCDLPHNNIAYERFTDTGPLALLPTVDPVHGDKRYALVWTAHSDQKDTLLNLSDAEFLAALQQRFGSRAGQFLEISPRHAYPLGLMQSREHVRHRMAFIGNAAHSLHPVAGQGFNLGLRDVAVLAEILQQASVTGQDPGSLATLRDYARWRRSDHWQAMATTDSLVRIFSSRFPPLMLARNLGLLALEICPPLKHLVARRAMGFVGKLPRLTRGLPL